MSTSQLLHCLLSTVYCLLSTVYCVLCIVYCLLSTVYYQLYTVYCENSGLVWSDSQTTTTTTTDNVFFFSRPVCFAYFHNWSKIVQPKCNDKMCSQHNKQNITTVLCLIPRKITLSMWYPEGWSQIKL